MCGQGWRAGERKSRRGLGSVWMDIKQFLFQKKVFGWIDENRFYRTSKTKNCF